MSRKDTPMMGCGHAANSRDGEGNPSCVICVGINPGARTVVDAPDLTGRVAKCSSCRNERPSAMALAFFEYLGPGSRDATQRCKCGIFEVAHAEIHPMTKRPGITDHAFEAGGPKEFDRFYCGCRGWN